MVDIMEYSDLPKVQSSLLKEANHFQLLRGGESEELVFIKCHNLSF